MVDAYHTSLLFRLVRLTCYGPTLICLLCVHATAAEFRDFQTTRLKSTGGTGVGSVLVEEATALNPASLAFFQLGSLYYQNTSSTTTKGPETELPGAKDFIISDASGAAKGSLAYHDQQIGAASRKRFSFAIGHAIGEASAFGVSTSQTRDKVGPGFELNRYYQTTFGITHVLNPELTLGIVAIDPFRRVAEDSMGIVGLQYVYKNFVSVMMDVGADYHRGLSETLLYRGALQLKIFDDFHLRAGAFRDRGRNETGNGAGISWIGPRISIEVAIQTINLPRDPAEEKHQIRETAFSVSYRF